MTIINPKSISGITSITTPSGSDNLFTVHTNNTTERVRINNDGDVIVGSGITVSPDGDIFTTGVTTSTTFVGALTGNVTGNATGLSGTPNISAGTIAGSTGTFTGDVDIADKIVHTGDTDTAIRFSDADTITAETGGTERLRINSSGQLLSGVTGNAGASDANAIFGGGGNAGTSSHGKLYITQSSSNPSANSAIGFIGFSNQDLNNVPFAFIGVYADADHGSNDYPSRFAFWTTPDGSNSASEKLRIASGGDVTVQTGNLVIGTSGKGIDFSATGDGSGASSVSELLDDYEEGFFTPTWSQGVSSPSYTNQHGGYVKVGRMVNFQINLSINGGTGTGDHLKIAGLPFTSGGATSVGYGGAVINYTGATFDQTAGITLHVGQMDDDVKFYNNNGSAVTGNSGNVNDITSHLIIHGQYITSS